ncbi:hypothetical protein SLEP1_g53612 [Rubroshorea leprosula]|uniref:Reverse transcriptase domain-containing protein n=1 Tax=Rubroshorea leprosula TaxID=152421 RepID=A0AAV5MCQ0_9ROSI|nr:hypothetical protein SLEP1_g53612 [Rubroshorea leprosula]
MASTRVRARGDASWGSGSRRQGYNRRFAEYGYWRKGQVESFFFYNFPESWDAKAMWHRFQEYGKVTDVFVPGKRDRRGKRFGFVRMEGVQDVKQVEEKLNRIWIGSYKLRVRLAVDRGQHRLSIQGKAGVQVNIREQRYVQPGKSFVQAVLGHSSKAGEDQALIKTVDGLPKGEAVDRVSSNQMMPEIPAVSGAAIKTGNVMVESMREEIIEFAPLHEEKQWLEGSMVAVVRSMSLISTIQERIDVDGGLINISPLGGRSLLLTERSKGVLGEYLQQHKDLFDLWCEDINPWAMATQQSARMVWLRVSGVPLKAWCDRCFETIGSSVGEVLKVEDEMFEVRIAEEEWRADPDWWLADEDRRDAPETESESGSEFFLSVNGEEDHELRLDVIRGTDEDDSDEDRLHEEGILYSNPVDGQAGNEVGREKEDGPDGPGVETGLKEPSCERLEVEKGRGPCVSGLVVQETGHPVQQDMGKTGEMYETEQKEISSARLLGFRDFREKRKKDLRECYSKEKEASREGGEWGSKKLKCNFVNVYAPTDRHKKVRLWAELRQRIMDEEGRWLIVGDFNAVRCIEERRGRTGESPDMKEFNNFVVSTGLVDLKLSNRRFTWYRPDGSSMSRLDRALLSGPKPFRVLDAWQQHPQFKKVVEDKWKDLKVEGYAGYRCKQKLKWLKEFLKGWNKEVFGNMESEFQNVAHKVAQIDMKNEMRELADREVIQRKEGFQEIWEILRKREAIWRQKSRSEWVKLGDQNSRFFHKMANGRKAQNSIPGLLCDGRWVEEPDMVKTEVFNFFRNMFQEEHWNRPKPTNLVFKRISDEQRLWLERPFSDEEIEEGLKSCAGGKAPGPDGYNFNFLKLFWNCIKEDFVNFFREFHQHSRLVKGLNSSFLALIPKKLSTRELKDFRPISLIGCMYKLLAKVLANRLKVVMPEIIGEAQSAFVGGRQLVDSVLVLNEVVDEVRIRKKSAFLFKADFQKAYDCVSWSFLDGMMDGFGFGAKWRGWIMECLSTARVSVLVNGSPTEEFDVEKGLRQGDPLSPFLFLMVVEGLNGLVKKAENEGLLHGIEVGKKGLVVSLLQFADDTVFLGRLTLLNSVLSALPTFFMSLFLMPKSVLDQLIKIQRDFLWGATANKRKIAWVKWDAICCSKEKGGLGVPDMRRRNWALLGKWWYRLGDGREGLWKRVVKDKYYGGEGEVSLIDVDTLRLSKIWGDILCISGQSAKLKNMLVKGFRWEVGDGCRVGFWRDMWVGNKALRDSFPRLFQLAENKDGKVRENGSWEGDRWHWVMKWRRERRGREKDEEKKLREVLGSVQIRQTEVDNWQWTFDVGGRYTVKTAYDLLDSVDSLLEGHLCKLVWCEMVPSKVSIFGWRLCLDRLPTRWNLQKRGMVLLGDGMKCGLCQEGVEDVDHLFCTCKSAWLVWVKVIQWWGLEVVMPDKVRGVVDFFIWCMGSLVGKKMGACIFLVVAWYIWYWRNVLVFQQHGDIREQLLELIQDKSYLWIRNKVEGSVFSFVQWQKNPVECARELTRYKRSLKVFKQQQGRRIHPGLPEAEM